MVRELNPDKRERFIQAALKLFVANGVQNTSTAEIAKEAGTAAGTLFLYFPTKQTLIHELALRISRDQSAYINSLLDPAQSARNMFVTIWNGSVRWLLDHMDAYRFVQQVRDSGIIAEAVVQETAQHLAYYYKAIQKGLDEGSIKPYPVELIGGILYQDIVVVMNMLQAQPDPLKQGEIIQQGFDIFWDGIKR